MKKTSTLLYSNTMSNTMRSKRRQLRKRRQLSTGDENVWQWLDTALRDERWRAILRERLNEVEAPALREIQF